MAKSLVIVESATKTKTIGKFLGKDYQILSSVGHVKDLPKQRLGVDLDDSFEPEYITIRGKGKILSNLRKSASTADNVYLATDPDREGEAIANHLAEEIKAKKQNVYRVLFNEITERAVKNALANPTKIDDKKVEAQKARRVVDRLVGYQVSPILWRTVYRGLSAGRVQSVALRLICEREDEIENFVPEEYWSITAKLQGEKTDPFLSKLHKVDKKDPVLPNEEKTREVIADLQPQTFRVKDVKKKKVSRNPAPPFTTSTLQQAAANRLGYTSKKIMMIAQQLYEGVELGREGSVGLITYMRTDSTRTADEALQAVREHILVNYGKEYLPASARKFKAKAGAQDAHEAIRPTSLEREPKKIKRYLTSEQFKLYNLIWNRFVASQMEAAKYEQTTIDILAGDRYLFRTTGSLILFRGFLQVYEDDASATDDQDKDEDMAIPKYLKVGDVLTLLDLMPKQHFTKPPARYSESSLIKELDAQGIGRPSTYAIIVSTILARKYVVKNQRQLMPTELGRTVNKILIQNFSELFNVKFTANMEMNLDEIESGKKQFLDVTRNFYTPFKQALEEVNAKQKEIKDSLQEETKETCPKCGKDLIIRWGRNGKFMACTGYPDCKYTKPLEEPETVDERCEKCGRNMVIKYGRFGRFLACSGYPDCKNTRPISTGVKCPDETCTGTIVEKRSKRGRTFYGCSNYPNCKFATWNQPVDIRCNNCGNFYLEKRSTKAKGDHLYCPACKAEIQEPERESYREAAYG
ncbi:type I DNA topoisomerase [candidate division KSB1 bacterium]|nr:type I DNA topoisomerase [candidate division KSB1 bacterium]NIR72420.1 type I DNA topoisomerase [candidate division KSB1 bacterium]NIS23585.1 type I DNA topoisomerase [candidate division KSB1 bacterium]NIT70511.1 type I DNA topoisomerase [candidate division KSB1 bacterium]NIU24219.1 type I DNA topoisomerase [candidate division KSB1 bacterium]